MKVFGKRRSDIFSGEEASQVKPRVQSRRFRRVAVRLGIIAGIGIGGFTAWRGSQWILDRWVFSNPVFALARIEARTDGIIPPDQIIRWSGARVGANLMALDLATIQRDLQLRSLIQSASIERILPNTLRIHIVEREPIARVSGFRFDPESGQFRASASYLDATGQVLQLADSELAESEALFETLPRIVGIPGKELIPGKKVSSSEARAALELIVVANRFAAESPIAFHTIDVSRDGMLRVWTDDGGEVALASHGLDPQLARWRLIEEFARRENKAIATLDLAVGNNVPARWNERLEPARPKPIRVSPYRKKNV